MTAYELYEQVIRLDGILTGKPESEVAQTFRSQAEALADPVEFVRSRKVYYLSDSGYSRFFITPEGEIALTSNSRDEVKKAWKTPEAAEVAETIRSAIMSIVDQAAKDETKGIINAARGVVPGR